MNILTANSIKQHGVSAIEKHMKYGPVHVFKHNHPLFVVISEKEYEMLTKQNKSSGLFALLNKTASGDRTKDEIDQQLQNDRDEWND